MERDYSVEQCLIFLYFAIFFCIVMALGDREGGGKTYIVYYLVRYCFAR